MTFSNVITFPTSKSGRYCKSYELATDVLICALIRNGRRFICLDELYDVLAAESDSEKNGVQWAVSGAKERGLIKSTKTQGFYKIT
jgi:hypothetical protein